jgi:hypothetical protein
LASRILDAQQQAQQKEQASTRKELVGSGDRSQRIRTYNYPQGRITGSFCCACCCASKMRDANTDTTCTFLRLRHTFFKFLTIGLFIFFIFNLSFSFPCSFRHNAEEKKLKKRVDDDFPIFGFQARENVPNIHGFTPLEYKSQNLVHYLQQYSRGQKATVCLKKVVYKDFISIQ